MELFAIPFLWVVFAVFSAVIASSKQRSAFGWFLIGFLFGPFGLLVGLMPSLSESPRNVGDFAAEFGQVESPSTTKLRPCPFCAELIKPEAVVCRFCQRDVPVAKAEDSELIRAAHGGDLESVRDALRRGAAVDARNEHGATSLYLAAVQNRAELVRLLLSHGADPAIRNAGGKTPREAAAEQGLTEIVGLLSS